HVLRAANLCFVERFDVERSAEDAQRLGSRVRSGEALLFFAEGTFTRAPGLRPFHMGAFLAAAQSGAPLVTVAVRGTRSVLRPDQWRPVRGPIHVRVAAPIRARYHDWSGAGELRRLARAEILSTCAEPDLED
ncbi:MAG TPA: lysophospholipid acyltransferase family protein, partial [Usitatibacter sp.]|nr:lysophospholipid acyltransferase family protein [Usitatibacter sp.]